MDTKIKKLYRSRADRILFGVCGGLGSYFDIDATIIRIAFVLLTLASGMGIIAYIIFLLIVPKEAGMDEGSRAENLKEFTKEAGEHAKRIAEEAKNMRWQGRRSVFGGVLIVLGVFLVAEKAFHLFDWWWVEKTIWPVIIILFGLFLVLRGKK